MIVLCALTHARRPDLAEACLTLSPQVALSHEAIFVEVSASHHLFSPEVALAKLKEILRVYNTEGMTAMAGDIPSALAFARFGQNCREKLPVAALRDYLSPFGQEEFSLDIFSQLGVVTIGDFLKIPRAEIPSRFGRTGFLAYERFLRAGEVAWPRFNPPEVLRERVDFDFASQIESLEPVLFLLRQLFHRIFLRLHARREKIVDFDLIFHLNRFNKGKEGNERERIFAVRLPLPQSDQKALLQLLRERLAQELQNKPLAEALEGITLFVRGTAPAPDNQRNFFSKAEEEREAFSSLVARLRERLPVFSAVPAPRLLPEASWQKALTSVSGSLVPPPPRPLRLFPPVPLRREKEFLLGPKKSWRILGFHGPERLRGEWWLGGFAREYFRVETESETLWVYRAGEKLFLHGVFD